MKPVVLRGLGLGTSVLYGGFIVWLYATRPQTFAEVAGGVASAVGLYEIDRAQFEEGLALFRADRFPEARAAFARADRAQRDPTTQFYVAYSYYRQGWGRLYNDDALFAQARRVLTHATSLASGGRIHIEDDPNLGLPDSDALRAELERGSKVEFEDLNPLRVLRKRQ
jgi:hypothetical protein